MNKNIQWIYFYFFNQRKKIRHEILYDLTNNTTKIYGSDCTILSNSQRIHQPSPLFIIHIKNVPFKFFFLYWFIMVSLFKAITFNLKVNNDV